MINSKSVEYKKRLIKTWDEIAPRYHRRWAKNEVGPFKSTAELIELARVESCNNVLDLACGTGAVTRRILEKIGPTGRVIGVDSSQTAIRIAKTRNQSANLDFVVADAESIAFKEKFDLVTCQYALFFFPDAQRVLKNAKKCLRRGGSLVLAVHGSGTTVPFFSSIIEVVTKFIPDYLPAGAPSLDRFGTASELKGEVSRAGFVRIKITQRQFEYSPGTFDNYWSNYVRYVAMPLKQKIRSLDRQSLRQMKEQIKQNTAPYTKRSGKIVFPWKVLLLTAVKP